MNFHKQFENTLSASRELNLLSVGKVNEILLKIADAAEKSTAFILRENQKDLIRMEESDPKYDRLKLTADRVKNIANDIRNVAFLPSPLGRVLSEAVRPNGLKIWHISQKSGK